MEEIIKEALTDSVIDEAIRLFAIDKNQFKSLGGFENFVFEYDKEDVTYVLRFVHSSHRDFNQVEAEIELIDYLYNNKGNVSQVVLSTGGNTLEKILGINDDYFTVASFVKAPGTFVDRSKIDDKFNYNFGKAVGHMHELTKGFKPVNKRIHWYEENLITHLGQKHLSEDDQFILDKLDKLVIKIKSLKIDNESYGLIHTDLHYGNMFYDGRTLTFFDFDDSAYKHYISDIAIIIFYQWGFTDLSSKDVEDKIYQFLKHFCEGYLEETKLDYEWFDHINDFLKLREIIMYIVLHAAGESKTTTPFAQKYFNKFRDRIKNDIPFFNFERAIGKR